MMGDLEMQLRLLETCESSGELVMHTAALMDIHKNDPIVLVQMLDIINNKNIELLEKEYGKGGVMDFLRSVEERVSKL